MPTREAADRAGVRVVLVEHPGLALAVQTGLDNARPGLVAFLDDDAVADPTWADRIEQAFAAAPRLGALGGRDNVDGDRDAGDESLEVGLVRRSGRVVGNHHLGHGQIREAWTVKGANMAFRTEAASGLPLARLVHGQGAQYRNELILTALVRRRGWDVAYDPRVQVDHFPARRAEGDGRQQFTPERIRLNVMNELVAFNILFPRSVGVYVLRTAVVGTRLHPGLVHMALGVARGDRAVVGRTAGTFRGLRELRRTRQLVVRALHDTRHGSS